MTKPRLLILTQYFPPEMGAPQVRLSELGERLIDRGWAVEALTALPNYPTGRVFDGYPRWRPMVETIGRIRTVRAPLFPSQKGFARRLASYFSFVASASAWGPRRCTRPDLVLCESPPLFLGLASRYLARRWRCPYVFNVSDLWPASAIHMGVVRDGSLPARLAERLELWLYRGAAAITGQSSEIIEAVAARVPEQTTAVITNGVESSRFGPEQADDDARALLGDAPGPVLLYAGLLGLAQGLDHVLDVARDLSPDIPGRVVLVGDGPVRDHLIHRVHEESITRVRILPAQPRERVPALLAAADVALISLGRTLPGAVPSKIYEAMASALPILLIAGGEPAARVTRAPAGIAVEPGNPEATAAAWQRLVTDAALRRSLGDAGRREAEVRYSRAAIADHLDTVLRRTLNDGSPSSGTADR